MHPAPVYFPISQTENTLNNFKLIFNRRRTAKALRSSISKEDPPTKKGHLKPIRLDQLYTYSSDQGPFHSLIPQGLASLTICRLLLPTAPCSFFSTLLSSTLVML